MSGAASRKGGRTRAGAVLAACAIAGALVTGCGHSGRTSAPASSADTSAGASAGAGSDSSAPSDSELARMRKLVDDADSAAAAAESDAAADK
ncbi:hypothetical protein ACIO6U_13810 [Streptomyces sp. NPDC087422]|uniref:hypothetical protein n=1 Tax=Streptomyces sp. NPDC087422 TaxID=3365786 RepID=UPI0037FB05A8